MKPLLPVLLAVTVTIAVAADPHRRFAYDCNLSRPEAVAAVADVFARHGWEVTDANPEVGTITGRNATRAGGSMTEVIHAASDGDSLRVVAYSYNHGTGQFHEPDGDRIITVLSHFNALGTPTAPARDRR